GSSLVDAKSTSGLCFFNGDSVMCWSSKKKEVVRSALEVEYVGATMCINHAVWFEKLLKDLGFKCEE
ncbi:hypothetical protein M569_04756, partial [Genlisea aurea]